MNFENWLQQTAFSRGVNARKLDGTLWSWGRNVYGLIGDNTTIYKSSPIQVPGTTWSCVEANESYREYA